MLVADVSVHDMPDGKQLADIAEEAVRVARRSRIEPRVALPGLLNLRPSARRAFRRVREAVSILDRRQVDSSTTATWRPTSRSTARR